ncbi:MAG: hypothetical protein JXB00_10685 [Bacteroidales bacterium]|nr:hypothetical protein [Bacteroidales bacterium]
MENTTINFRRERDFGEVFGATFDFIRQEFKKFGTVILYYVLPFLVISALLMILAQYNYKNVFSSISGSPEAVFSFFGDMFLYWLLLMLSVLLTQTMIISATYSYVSLYVKKGRDGFTIPDVWEKMKGFILPVLGTNFVVGLIVIIGFVACLIPGIYLGVSLSIIFAALIIEEKGFGSAFSRSFELTKQNWWMTLLIVFIATLLVYILALIIQIPAMAIGIGSFWTTIQESIANQGKMVDPSSFFNTTYIIVTSISNVLVYIIYIVPNLILSFWYFSLLETKEKPSLMEKIEKIGE